MTSFVCKCSCNSNAQVHNSASSGLGPLQSSVSSAKTGYTPNTGMVLFRQGTLIYGFFILTLQLLLMMLLWSLVCCG